MRIRLFSIGKNKGSKATVIRSNRIVCNPFFLYSVSWFIVVFLYLLNWSDKYPLISSNLLFFLLATSLLSLIFSVKTHKNRDFEYKALVNPLNYYKWVMKQTRRVKTILPSISLFSVTLTFC